MSRNNLPTHGVSDEHPPMALLRQYQNGTLPSRRRHEVERHLVSCELCSDVVDGMALARPARVKTAVRETRGRLKNLLAQKKRKRKVFEWPVWQTAAVLLVLAFAVAEVLYHHYFLRPASHFPQTAPTVTTWQITGTVTDAAGQPLPGAQVQWKEKDKKTVSDPAGLFRIEVAGQEATLVVSLSGYRPRQVTVAPAAPALQVILQKTE